MVNCWVLCIACYGKVTVVIDMALCMGPFSLILHIFLHVVDYLQVGLSLLHERPSVDILRANIVFHIVVYFFFVVEDILYLLPRELTVWVLLIEVLGSKSWLWRP